MHHPYDETEPMADAWGELSDDLAALLAAEARKPDRLRTSVAA
jgi:hypothetical protein